jgi:RecA/RadA recombinase
MTVPRLPSGSFAFDMITGGGIPRNRFTVFHGPKSSSKTTFALRCAGMFQMLKPDQTVIFIDFEGSFDWKWASSYIPDRERLIVVKPDYGEEGIDIIKAYVTGADDVGLYIIDSLAGILPVKEAEAAAADYTQLGLQVRLVNRMLRIMIPPMSKATKEGREMTVIAINQIRANMQTYGHGPAFSQPCGKFLEHAASMDIRFWPGKYTQVRNVPIKVAHKFAIDKNKVGMPTRTGEFIYYLTEVAGYQSGELEEEKVVLTYAKRAGFIVRDGNKWKITIPLKKEPIDINVDKLENLMTMLREDRKLFGKIKLHTLRACVKNPFLSSDEEEDK